MATELQYINAALTRTGNDPITSLEDTSTPGATIANENYENLVLAELANHPWKRATKIGVLNRLDPDVHGDAPPPWTAAYTLPADFVEIRTAGIAGLPIDYEVHGNTLLANAGASDDFLITYVWRVPEAQWPPWFAEGITRRLEAMFLRGIGERYREAEARDEAATEQFAKARSRDSQAQPSRNPWRSPLLEARGGRPYPYDPYADRPLR